MKHPYPVIRPLLGKTLFPEPGEGGLTTAQLVGTYPIADLGGAGDIRRLCQHLIRVCDGK